MFTEMLTEIVKFCIKEKLKYLIQSIHFETQRYKMVCTITVFYYGMVTAMHAVGMILK